jgi:hypothetical protein
MKRGFIRAVWGIYDDSNRKTKRRKRIDADIANVLRNKFIEPFRVYVMGKENYEAISKQCPDCVMIDENPFRFDLIQHQYRNKLEVIQYAMEEDGYDEMVYLDWDCLPTKKLTDEFWIELGKKEVFQANLQVYHRRKCLWRERDVRKVPNGGFIYLRDKTFPSQAIEWWNKSPCDNDEPSWARVTDALVDGWKGIEKYWDFFEPMVCDLHRMSPYSNTLINTKNRFFLHKQGGNS